MTALFDGVASLMTGVFGRAIVYHPAKGSSRPVESIFREVPIDVVGADGQEVRIVAPTWRVQRDLAPEVRRGDRITVPDGRTLAVMVVHPTGSPASDAFLVCELQEVPA